MVYNDPMNKPRIYLDNAATSWPKRRPVLDAALNYMTQCGATAGRGNYSSALQAECSLANARLEISKLISAGDARSIAFCNSGTHALNAALFGVLRPGDHVIATEIEHNSVLRPLKHLAEQRGITFQLARSDARGVASLGHAAELIQPATRWFVVGHASNVTGAVQNLSDWRELAKRSNAKLMVDVSQTLGYLPIDFDSFGIDVLATAGHKGLGGLSGTGFLCADAVSREGWQPLMTGGTGSKSDSIDIATTWPETVEVGNQNLPGIISMSEAAACLVRENEISPIAWQTQWRSLMAQLISGLREIPRVKLIGYDGGPVDRVPLVSIIVDGWDVHELASVLDSDFAIEARSGYHCAAMIHQAIGTDSCGGTLRISPGHATTSQEIDAFLTAIRELAG